MLRERHDLRKKLNYSIFSTICIGLLTVAFFIFWCYHSQIKNTLKTPATILVTPFFLGDTQVTKTYTSSNTAQLSLASAKSAKKVIVGDSAICVLATDSQVYCVGSNGYGKLGQATASSPINNAARFILPSGLSAEDFKIASSQWSEYSTTLTDAMGVICVQASDQQLYCAGNNTRGQLGIGSTTSTGAGTPARFAAPGSPYQTLDFSLGGRHVCITTKEQTIYCSGSNDAGQLAQASSTTQVTTPINVGGGYRVFAGVRRTCVISYDQSNNYCTGINTYGEHGAGSTTSPQYTYTIMTRNAAAFPYSSTIIRDVSITGNSTCILAYVASCMGLNSDGQLGQNNTTNSSVPVGVNPPALASGRPAGYMFASLSVNCVVIKGDAYCAGRNSDGQIGIGNTTNPQRQFVRFNVPTNIRISKIKVTNSGWSSPSTCALGVDTNNNNKGSLWCAGVNTSGQLGDTTTISPRTNPVQFQLPSGLSAVDFDADTSKTCALASDSQVYCAGAGPLGDGLGSGSPSPVRFVLPSS